MPQKATLCKGLVERIGQPNSSIHYTKGPVSIDKEQYFENHAKGLEAVIKLLTDRENGVITDLEEIKAVGHRVVHGGEAFNAPTIITPQVLDTIKELSFLAPLHNPANAVGISTATALFSKAAQVAVFDTAFHQSIPKKAHTYAIPKELSHKHNIRVYGFHGTSHKYVSERAIAHLGLQQSKLISIHLGNGCSMTAIENGKSVEHSLGFAPSNGLIMGTRSGDVDQSVLFFLMNEEGQTPEELNEMLQKKSGLLGLTGYSDLRDIQRAAENGNEDCILALEMTVHRVKKFIGAYMAVLNGLDALIFTAGIGENSTLLRKMICTDFEGMGIVIDHEKNKEVSSSREVAEFHDAKSAVRLLVVPTNEELEIANQTYNLLEQTL